MVEENRSLPQIPASEQTAVKTAVSSVWVSLLISMGLSALLGLGMGLIQAALLVNASWSIYMAFSAVSTALILLVSTIATNGAAVWYYASRMHFNPLAALRSFRPSGSWVLKGICMGYFISTVLSLAIQLVNIVLNSLFGISVEAAGIEAQPYLSANLINFITVVIAAPILEELFYRGVVFKSLTKYSPGFAVVFSALLFGAAHLNLGQSLPVFGLGIVLAYVYYRSGNLWTAIGVHAFNNLLAMISTLAGTNDLMQIVISLIVLALCAAGLVITVLQKKELSAMFEQCVQAKSLWNCAGHSVLFWLLIAALAIGTLSMLF